MNDATRAHFFVGLAIPSAVCACERFLASCTEGTLVSVRDEKA